MKMILFDKRSLGFARDDIFCHFDEPPTGGEEKSQLLFDNRMVLIFLDDLLHINSMI